MPAPTIHRLRVSDVIEETADARSVVFEIDATIRDRFAYRPGQFLTLRIPGTTHARCYSLASAPGLDDDLKITIKRVDQGLGSNWLCDNARRGVEIEVLEPSGVFTPKGLDARYLLVAGGSGVTPIMSILKSVLGAGNGEVVLFYANRDEQSVIFEEELRSLCAQHPDRLWVEHWIETIQGRPTADGLTDLFRSWDFDEVFVCGPQPFMDCTRKALSAMDFPRERLHIERFTSLGSDPFADTDESEPAPTSEPVAVSTVTVRKGGEEHTVQWPANQRLLQALDANGIVVPSSCAEGVCASCECRLTAGSVEMVNNQVLEEDDIADGYILACQALPRADVLEVEFE
ncbi:2Fe-2S iron-sulfur cluster-binding protein [Rhodococcus gannanensis]|uniref:2Fe-2S iron-sulfur cluster-binding protein n=1 Tax=Rhodococcus gannanensis TaxID=1960308 RepID=A0ABW4PD90_9NOCA